MIENDLESNRDLLK